jgi:hypothetical protein
MFQRKHNRTQIVVFCVVLNQIFEVYARGVSNAYETQVKKNVNIISKVSVYFLSTSGISNKLFKIHSIRSGAQASYICLLVPPKR